MKDEEKVIAHDLQKKVKFMEDLIQNVLTIPEDAEMPKEARDASDYYRKGAEKILEHLKTEYSSVWAGDLV